MLEQIEKEMKELVDIFATKETFEKHDIHVNYCSSYPCFFSVPIGFDTVLKCQLLICARQSAHLIFLSQYDWRVNISKSINGAYDFKHSSNGDERNLSPESKNGRMQQFLKAIQVLKVVFD
jgi:hypothetical protein